MMEVDAVATKTRLPSILLLIRVRRWDTIGEFTYDPASFKSTISRIPSKSSRTRTPEALVAEEHSLKAS